MSDNKITYVMPKVSVIMRDSGNLSPGMTYDYGFRTLRPVKQSFLQRFLYGTFNLFGFLIAMSLFVISVSLTSYMLVSAMNSPAIVQMKTQDVPSDGIERNYIHTDKKLKSVENR